MGLDSVTLKLRKNLDALEESQKKAEASTKTKLRRSRALSSQAVGRIDGLQGRTEIRRAIDTVLPKVAGLQDAELRLELELVLGAAREQL